MAQRWDSSSFFLLLPLAMLSLQSALAIPAIFIFGDSTADVGTNNYINECTARADFLYNGIDFPHSKPTGRFSNGLNSADFLAKLMGFRRSPPPFLSLYRDPFQLKAHILSGLNFASGGSGILDNTGQQFVKVVPMGEQIQQFATVSRNLTEILGPEAAESFLSKSLFFISIGSNDILEYAIFNVSSKQEFMATLTSKYEDHLRMLFTLGARKFGIVSVPAIGCCPSQRVQNSTGGCLEELNDYSRVFYSTTEALMCNLSSELTGMKYSLGNAHDMVMNIIDNPLSFNFTELASACCGNGTLNGESPCAPDAKVCSDRHVYLFWDMYHPTQAAADMAAVILYGGGPRFVNPMNFRQLAEDDS